MTGFQRNSLERLFYSFNLEDRIPQNQLPKVLTDSIISAAFASNSSIFTVRPDDLRTQGKCVDIFGKLSRVNP
jgi:hypothetical protein